MIKDKTWLFVYLVQKRWKTVHRLSSKPRLKRCRLKLHLILPTLPTLLSSVYCRKWRKQKQNPCIWYIQWAVYKHSSVHNSILYLLIILFLNKFLNLLSVLHIFTSISKLFHRLSPLLDIHLVLHLFVPLFCEHTNPS